MDHDEKILNYISNDENISQRQLAKLTNLSVGHLNFLLHKMVNKGLLTIEKINSRNFRYILTPQGIARNARRTYCYIRNAVRQVILLKSELETIFEQYENNNITIYIDGENDEVQQVVQLAINGRKPDCVKWVEDLEELEEPVKNKDNSMVLLWDTGKEELYKLQGVKCINLLDRINDL